MTRSYLQWPCVRIEMGKRGNGELWPSPLYLKHSREASGMGSWGLCLSPTPVVNQLGDQRRRWGKCHKALPQKKTFSLSLHLVQSEWQHAGGRQNSRGDEQSKGDNHSTCQGLIWTTRTQSFRKIYKKWHSIGKETPNKKHLMCWDDLSLPSEFTDRGNLAWILMNDSPFLFKHTFLSY